MSSVPRVPTRSDVRRPPGGLAWGRAGAAAGLALALLLGSGRAAAPAQEPASPPGWIGIGLEFRGDCAPPAAEACGPAVVGSVILGGPAAEAGIEPGDTLLAVGERKIRRGLLDPVFRQLPVGEPLSVQVARNGERIRVRLVPRPRPDSLAVVRIRGQLAPPPAGGEEPPRPAGHVGYGLALPEAVLPPEAPTPAGLERIRGTEPELTVLRLVPMGGQPGEFSRELVRAREEALREAMKEARAQMRRDRAAAPPRRMARDVELRAARAAAQRWRSWIDDSLKAHLDAIHDSVLSVARQRLQALAEGARKTERGGAAPPTASFSGARARIAGAELEALNPRLSEVFGGLERGVLVLRVLAQTPAAELGLRPGDVIVEVDGRPVGSVEGLRALLRNTGSEPVMVKWVRKETEHTGRLQR